MANLWESGKWVDCVNANDSPSTNDRTRCSGGSERLGKAGIFCLLCRQQGQNGQIPLALAESIRHN
jgi:hypothetical protein